MFKKRLLTLVFVICLFTNGAIVFAGPLEDCAEYTKMGVPGQNGELLCRKGYLLSHSQDKKTPFWVIEHLTAERASANVVQRYNKFQADPDLGKGKRAELSDYKNSGYDRGHMAPSADMKWDQDAMVSCFYLSNMATQVGEGMNRGIWASLEGKVRNWAISRGDLFVFTGPIYQTTEIRTIGKNKVSVPTHFYKIIYDPNKAEAIAFIMPNIPLSTKDMPNYIVRIRDIEELTGLDFLSALDRKEQDRIETNKSEKLWQ